VLLSFRFAQVASLNRDASGNVVLAVRLAGVTFSLDFSNAGQLTGASVFGISIPVGIL
jgi:hypothetical protein